LGLRLTLESLCGLWGVASIRFKAASLLRFVSAALFSSGGFTMVVTVFLVNAGDPADPEIYHMTGGPVSAPNNIDMAQVIELAEYDPIWAYRGKAIQAYATLESTLNHLLVSLTGMAWEDASIVFYKIVNTGSRRSIFEKLLQRKFGTKFNPFWNDFVRQLRVIDDKRNEIAHWVGATYMMVNVSQLMLMGCVLIPPASLHTKASSPRITINDLIAFREKCTEFASLASGFAMRIKPPEGMPDQGEPWFDIYQLPFVYPLPEGHPSKLKTAIQRTHPQAFPASLRFLRPQASTGHLEVWIPES